MTNEARTHCIYCHGWTFADDRGNCLACGAPKTFDHVYFEEHKEEVFEPYYLPGWTVEGGSTSYFGGYPHNPDNVRLFGDDMGFVVPMTNPTFLDNDPIESKNTVSNIITKWFRGE